MFLLFAGYYRSNVYTCGYTGGWNDFRGQFQTYEEALNSLNGKDYHWWQIADKVSLEFCHGTMGADNKIPIAWSEFHRWDMH